MSETKFTRAPWRLDGSVIRGQAHEGHERPVCELYRKISVDPETLANASLIAAAPDLLEALKWAMAQIGAPPKRIKGQNEGFCDKYDAARTALSKALGKEG